MRSYRPEDANNEFKKFFRREYTHVISALTRIFGTNNFDLIEDAVQESLLKAHKIWPYKGIPDNPSAWIRKIARNAVIDKLRRSSNYSLDTLSPLQEEELGLEFEIEIDKDINDSLLSMMFACCHPKLSEEQRIILVLKILCGFGNREISRALIKSEDAIAKAYYRSKLKWKQEIDSIAIPFGRDLETRLDSVLGILYLMFNEGYNSATGELLIQKDICSDAIRLTKMLLEHKMLVKPEVHALLALMYYQSSRFDSRIDANGDLLTLKEQDPEQWDLEMIDLGNHHLEHSKGFGKISAFHIEATIAACHCFAPSYAETNWPDILDLYNTLLRFKNTPVVQVHRMVAFMQVHGAKRAQEEIKKLDSAVDIRKYHLYHAVRAEIELKAGDYASGICSLDKAIGLTSNPLEIGYLQKKKKGLVKRFGLL